MSTYVMSDLHGNYQAYRSMLEKIQFKDDDMLYILGDILDRGEFPISIILDVMERINVEVIIGNHCVMAYDCLSFLMQEVTDVNIDKIDEATVGKLLDWHRNGADTTIAEFRKCDKETQKAILDFILDFELYDEIEVDGKTFVLVHAGLDNFDPDRALWDYSLNEVVWKRMDYEKVYYQDKYIITGHTPTMLIAENSRPGYIYQKNGHIAIDCGCSFAGGRLGCLRLEDMKEFYVETGE